jgi:phosphoglycerate kinase
MRLAKEKGVKIILPVDFVCGNKFDNTSDTAVHDLSTGIPDGWLGLDAGPKTVELNR